MNKKYESPVIDMISIKVNDIMAESNELPEIDLNGVQE